MATPTTSSTAASASSSSSWFIAAPVRRWGRTGHRRIPASRSLRRWCSDNGLRCTNWPSVVHAPGLGGTDAAGLAATAVFDDRRDSPLRRTAVAVAHEIDVDHEVDGLGDQAPHRVLGQLGVALGDVEREPTEHRLDRVGVDRGHRSALAHRRDVEHLQGLVLDELADDHPVGVQASGELDQFARRHRAAAFGVGLAGVQRRCIGMPRIVFQPQLEQTLLDGHDALQRRHGARATPSATSSCRRRARRRSGSSCPPERVPRAAGRRRAGTSHACGQPVEPDPVDREPSNRDARLRRDAAAARTRRAP